MNNLSAVQRRLQSSYSKTQLKNYCDLLGIPVQASEAKIKQAFYKKSLQHHPDRNPGSEKSAKLFSEINEAYQALIFDRRYGGSGPMTNDFSNRWKYTSRNEFRQWQKMKPKTERTASTAWRDVHSEESWEARRKYKESNDTSTSWFGQYYKNMVEEDFEFHRQKRAAQSPRKRSESAQFRSESDSGCILM